MSRSQTASKTTDSLLRPKYWLSWLGIGVLWLLTQLPHPWRLRVGRLLGWLTYHLIPRRRAIAAQNIQRCFPELDQEQRAKLLREHFSALGMGLMELTTAWWASDEEIARLVRLTGVEYAEQEINKGRGVILLSAHFTTLDLGGRGLSQRLRSDPVYRHLNNPVSNAVMLKARSKHHGLTIHRDNVKAMVRQLKNSRPVWIAPDQKFRGKASVEASFFGNRVATNPAVARLARITGAAVVPQCFRRLDDGSYEVILFPPLEDFPSGDLARDTQVINDQFEKMIRMAPEQYFWVHNRFG